MPLRLIGLLALALFAGAFGAKLFYDWDFLERREWLTLMANTAAVLLLWTLFRLEDTASPWVQRLRFAPPQRGWRFGLACCLALCSIGAWSVLGYEAYERIKARDLAAQGKAVAVYNDQHSASEGVGATAPAC
jgi:hypothetical protein